MVNQQAPPRKICHVPGKRSYAIDLSNSKRERADECGGDRTGAGEMVTKHKAAGGGPVGHVGIDVLDRERRQRAADAASVPAIIRLR